MPPVPYVPRSEEDWTGLIGIILVVWLVGTVHSYHNPVASTSSLIIGVITIMFSVGYGNLWFKRKKNRP
jgi:hypothetical protein